MNKRLKEITLFRQQMLLHNVYYKDNLLRLEKSKRNKLNRQRKKLERFATPQWANKFYISEIYSLARLRTKILGEKYEVDHIIPITHNLVCGLHVENNLQVIKSKENRKKSNKFEGFGSKSS